VPALSVQRCGPVENHGHGRSLCLFDLCINQKSLPVPAHILNEQVPTRKWLPRSGLEKCDGRAGIEIVTGCNRYSHDLAVRREVEQLFAVAPPPGLPSCPRRDLPPAAWLRKGGNVNLPLACLIGRMRQPFSARRELAIRKDRRRFQELTAGPGAYRMYFPSLDQSFGTLSKLW
jgi:hypothetical protein